MRALLAVSSALVLSFAGGAVAAPKPICNQLTDPAGDEWEVGNAVELPLAPEPAADLLSGDIASNSTWVTVALRPKSLAPPADPWDRVDLRFSFRVNDDGQGFWFEAQMFPEAPVFQYGYFATSGNTSGRGTIGPAKGVVDHRKKEVRVSVKVADLKKKWTLDPRFFHRFTLSAEPISTIPTVYRLGDGAQDVDAQYRRGTKTCLTPGR